MIIRADEARAVRFAATAEEEAAGSIRQYPGVERLLRQSLARFAGEDADIEDLGDIVDLFQLCGLSDQAILLRSVIAVHRGVVHLGRLELPAITIIDDLARIPDLAPRDDGGAIWWTGVSADLQAENDDGHAPALGEQQIGFALSRLHLYMMAEASNANLTKLGETIDALAPLVDSRPFDLIDVTCPLSQLAMRAACNSLRLFLRRRRTLAYPPFGSAALLHAAARLRHGVLGPYLSNVERLLVSSRDILGLIRLAIGPGAEVEHPELFDRWLVLLADDLPDSRVRELIDVLGDNGLLRPMWAILSAHLARYGPQIDQVLLWRIRDAALDLGDPRFGLSIQRLIAQLRPADALEFVALAEIEAVIGDDPAVERALCTALALNPDDSGIQDRLRALRNGHFMIYRAEAGFGSSRETTRIRRRYRRGSPPPDVTSQIMLGS